MNEFDDEQEQLRPEDDDGDEGDEDYSGPYCRHWGDPADCDEACAECGHQCMYHADECTVLGCKCPAWVYDEDAEP